MKKRYAGDTPFLSASEVNMLGEAATRTPGGLMNDPAALRRWPVVMLHNKVGADIAYGEHVGINSTLPWEIDPGKNTQWCAEAVAPSDGKPVAISTGFVADEKVGMFIVLGVAIAKVAAGTGRMANLDSSRTLQPAQDGKIQLLGNPSAAKETYVPVLLDSGSTHSEALFLTPAGGIGKVTRTGDNFNVPKADCTMYEWNGDVAEPTQEKHMVYNVSDQAIAADVLIKASMVAGKYVVDVAGCGP